MLINTRPGLRALGWVGRSVVHDMIDFLLYRFIEMFHSELTEADLEEELGPPGTKI
jgi:hypothetical protein